MISSQLQAQVRFLTELENLKQVVRANRTVDSRYENSAEHSWHVAMMALVFSDYARVPLDMLKVTRMLLIHDVVEIDAGDTWLYDDTQDKKKRDDEKKAANRIFGLLPEPQSQEYRDLWAEFEIGVSEEARFAAAIDGIQPLLNHVITGSAEAAKVPVQKVREKKAFIQDVSPDLWPLVEDLISQSFEKGLYV